ncbi:hypothetical protein ACOYR1_12055 [Thalassotalea piscium]
MKKHANIAELIQALELEVKSLNDDINTLKEEPQNFNEKVLFKYIDTGSTGKTKDFVREMGVKAERGSLFSSGDVTKLIKEGADDISPKLLVIARKVLGMKNKNGKYS